jgi:hypothetical protein
VGVYKLGLEVSVEDQGNGGCATSSCSDSYAIALEPEPGREIGAGDRVTRWGLFLTRGVQDHIFF